MFVLERLLNNRRQKQIQWHKDAKVWVEKANEMSNYSRYGEEDYAKHIRSYPGVKWHRVAQVVGIVIGAAIILFLISSSVSEQIKHDDAIKNTTKPGMSCRVFNKGDHIKIVAGDYEGATGHIVGGCQKGDDYQIELDNQKLNVGGDGTSEEKEVGGKVINEWNYKKMIKLEEKK